MDLQVVAAAIFVLGVIGVVVWMLSRLGTRYAAERAAQPPEQQSSPLLTIVVAIAIYGVLTALTDYRTALTLGGIAILVVIDDIRRRVVK